MVRGGGHGTGARRLPGHIAQKIHARLERRFPEKRLFLRTDSETRFIRLTPARQLLAWSGAGALVAWSIIATAFLLIDTIGSGNLRDQAQREQLLYEARLNELSAERDARAAEARNAQERFNVALRQVSAMQLELLKSEDRLREMEQGIEAVQATLRRTIRERDEARAEAERLQAELSGEPGGESLPAASPEDTAATADFLTAALAETAAQRDAIAKEADRARAQVAELEMEQKLLYEKNDRIFSQLEDAVSLSLEPLDKMFRAAGLPTEQILDTVRRGYSGQGGPLMPLTFSTRGEEPDPDSIRANAILQRLDLLNLYRIAAEKVPLVLPLKSPYRLTSPYGPRWGKLHEGLDMAAPYGTPIYAPADGVVVFAGWSNGYGRLTKIRHEFGIETRYAHQAKIRVKVGQRVSRGERIGDMGSSGRSTGSHVHYEIRVNGKSTNPMKFIKAGRNVF